MLSSLEKAIVGIRDQGTVDFDVFDQRERAFLHEFEERPNSGLIIPSRCEGSYSCSFQERLLSLDTSNDRPVFAYGGVATQTQWPVVVAGFAVSLFASRLASYSRNFVCQVLETL